MIPASETHTDSKFPDALIRDYLISAATRQYEKVCYLIESKGLHPDSTLAGKPTALCYAVLQPSHCLLEYLVAKGANINHKDGMGMTPLHYAAIGGCEFCISYLVKQGAELNATNYSGQTPLGIAISRSHSGCCTEYLVRLGASGYATIPAPRSFH